VRGVNGDGWRWCDAIPIIGLVLDSNGKQNTEKETTRHYQPAKSLQLDIWTSDGIDSAGRHYLNQVKEKNHLIMQHLYTCKLWISRSLVPSQHTVSTLDQALIVVYLNSEVVPWWNLCKFFMGVYLHRHGPQHHDKSVTHVMTSVCFVQVWMVLGLCIVIRPDNGFCWLRDGDSPQPHFMPRPRHSKEWKQQPLFVCSSWCPLSTSAVKFTHEYAIYFYPKSRPSQPSTFKLDFLKGSTWSPGRSTLQAYFPAAKGATALHWRGGQADGQ